MYEPRIVIVNSVIGKKGSIGQRYSMIVEAVKPDLIIEKFSNKATGTKLFFTSLISYIRASFKKRNKRKIESWFRTIEYWVFYLEVIIRIPKSGNGGLIVIRDAHYNLISFLKKRNYKVFLDMAIMPVFMVEHYYPTRFYTDKNLRRNEINSFKIADLIIVPSRFIEKWMMTSGFHNVKYVQFGVSISGPKKTVPKNKSTNGKGSVLFLGSRTLRKGYDIVEKISNSFPELDFYFYGQGFSNKKEANRIYKSFSNDIDYNDFDLMLFPTLIEGCSKAVLECLLSGMPVVTNISSGVEPITGVYFCKLDCVESIKYNFEVALQKSRDEEYRKRISQHAASIYSKDMYVERWKKILCNA